MVLSDRERWEKKVLVLVRSFLSFIMHYLKK